MLVARALDPPGVGRCALPPIHPAPVAANGHRSDSCRSRLKPLLQAKGADAAALGVCGVPGKREMRHMPVCRTHKKTMPAARPPGH